MMKKEYFKTPSGAIAEIEYPAETLGVKKNTDDDGNVTYVEQLVENKAPVPGDYDESEAPSARNQSDVNFEEAKVRVEEQMAKEKEEAENPTEEVDEEPVAVE